MQKHSQRIDPWPFVNLLLLKKCPEHDTVIIFATFTAKTQPMHGPLCIFNLFACQKGPRSTILLLFWLLPMQNIANAGASGHFLHLLFKQGSEQYAIGIFGSSNAKNSPDHDTVGIFE
jgi:hypothetical protein